MAVRLNLGSGPRPLPGHVNCDRVRQVGTNVLLDLGRGLPFRSDSVDAIYSNSTLHYVPNDSKVLVMNEIWRVLRTGGRAEIRVPSALYPDAYAPPTARSQWQIVTFDYFIKGHWRCEEERPYSGFVGGFVSVLREVVRGPNCEGNVSEQVHVILEKCA